MTIRILIVEDEIDIRRGIAIELAHHKSEHIEFEVLEAADVAEALNLLAGMPLPNLILTDLMMPSSPRAGFELIQVLKQNEAWQTIPVIVLSARSSAGDILDALKMGAIDYLVKPYEPEELVSRVIRGAQFQQVASVSDVAVSSQALWRKAHVDAMKLVLLYWELTTQRNKHQFADGSGIWRVYIDKKGTCSTKTLDKYLHLESLPAKPKTHNVERSIQFVLSACQGQEAVREALESMLPLLLRH